MKILELFSGYGTASFALKQLGINYECVGYSDIDKYANQCFQQNHGGKELGDCTKIDPNELKDFDLLTGGFPCQAFSIAGKGLGELDTRGTLFNEIIRIAAIKKPRYMMLENVKGLLNKKHKPTFDKIVFELRRIGYHVTWKILNTKEHGIPQNRERVFFCCFKYIEDYNDFKWPEKEELKILLKDILEEDVDDKYYLSGDKVEKLLADVDWSKVSNDLNKITMPVLTPDRLEKRQNGRRFKTDGEPMFTINTQDRHGILQINKGAREGYRIYSDKGVSPTIAANSGGVTNNRAILQLNNPSHSNDRVYLPEGISPTLNTMQGGDRQPFILVKNATKRGYLLAVPGDGINLEHPNSETRRGRVQPQIAPTLQCNDARGVLLYDLTIRKLTPKECFRLQGFLNDEVNVDGISNSQQYKLAGNGQSVNVVKKIFSSLNLNKTNENTK